MNNKELELLLSEVLILRDEKQFTMEAMKNSRAYYTQLYIQAKRQFEIYDQIYKKIEQRLEAKI